MYGGGYIGGEETLQANQDDPIALAEFEARIAAGDKIEPKDWNKILIVGDHTPPFLIKKDRNFYVDGKAPYLLITKR